MARNQLVMEAAGLPLVALVPCRQVSCRIWPASPATGGCPASGARPKAQVALGNTQMRVYHVLLSNPGMRYHDLGADYYEHQRVIARQVSYHVGKLGSLGYEVTLCRHPDPSPGQDAPAA